MTPASAALSTKAVLLNSSGFGEFTFTDVPDGNYVLYIKRPGYLTRCMNVAITSSSPSTLELQPPGTGEGGVFYLWSGDANNDGRVDISDYMLVNTLLDQYTTVADPSYNPAYDFNADGQVNVSDLMLVSSYWDKTIMDYPGANTVNFGI
jgi:hypothetical protein